jgi:hypothetical protein
MLTFITIAFALSVILNFIMGNKLSKQEIAYNEVADQRDKAALKITQELESQIKKMTAQEELMSKAMEQRDKLIQEQETIIEKYRIEEAAFKMEKPKVRKPRRKPRTSK